MDPAALASAGGLGQDVAACNGISLSGYEQPGPDPYASPPCAIAESAITSKYGPDPTREQLLSEGGLGADYASCKGISLAAPEVVPTEVTATPEPSAPTDAFEVAENPLATLAANPPTAVVVRPGIRLLAQSAAASTKPMLVDEAPARTLKSAPVVATSRAVVAIVAQGMKPGAVVEVGIRKLGQKQSKYSDLANVRVGQDGSVALPVMKLQRGARFVLALREADSLLTNYMKVVIKKRR